MLQEKLSKDYHVLVINMCQEKDIEFECYNSPDLNEKTFDELKKYVKQIIN